MIKGKDIRINGSIIYFVCTTVGNSPVLLISHFDAKNETPKTIARIVTLII